MRWVTANPLLDAVVTAEHESQMMKMSGTSMATPTVAGLLLSYFRETESYGESCQSDPRVHRATTRRSQQLRAGSSEMNLEGAVRLAGLVRTDLAALSTGDALLTDTADATSTIAGDTFNWGGGVFRNGISSTGPL